MFIELKDITKRSTFVEVLTEIMTENQLVLAEENDSAVETTVRKDRRIQKTKYKHFKSFFEECVIMREQHPQNECISFRDTGHKEWRKKCMEMLKFDPAKMGPFGATFREQIYVSTLPESCFFIVEELDENFQVGNVKTTIKKTKMTSGVYQCLVGFYDEAKISEILGQLNDGEITLSEFRETAKLLKANQKTDKTLKEAEMVRLRTENRKLQQENNRLVAILKQEKEKRTDTLTAEVVTPAEKEPAAGDLVEARWDENSWYQAKILAISEKLYRVKYEEDGVIRTYPRSALRISDDN